MKVAVLVSGSCRTKTSNNDISKQVQHIKEKFPDADFYYATWSSYKDDFENLFPNESCLYVDEPAVEYHPWFDIDPKEYLSRNYARVIDGFKKQGPERIEWASHHCKQIVIHAELLKSLDKKYDVIVRTRYDAYVSPKADFSSYIEDTYINNRANCFANRASRGIHVMVPDSKECNFLMYDILIIHPYSSFNADKTLELFYKHELLAAEHGWAQVLSKDFGYNHRNHSGWVSPDYKIFK